MTTTSLYIRFARPDDKAAVVAMVATIWDGHDYIPDVWDSWLNDAGGVLLVGVFDERPVAIAKITALLPGEDWFEGLRVDPAFRGRGFARAMLQRCAELSRERGARTLRYMTDEDNPTMHRVGEALGFTLRYRVDEFIGGARVGTPVVQPLTLARLPRLLADLQCSPLLQLTGGLYTYDWTAYPLTEARLRAHIARGEIVALPGGKAWAIIEPDTWFGYWLAHAEGEQSELERLCMTLRAMPMHGERARIRAQMHPDAPLIAALLATGYTRKDDGVRLYEMVF